MTNWIDSSGASTEAGAKPKAPKLTIDAIANIAVPILNVCVFSSSPASCCCCRPSAWRLLPMLIPTLAAATATKRSGESSGEDVSGSHGWQKATLDEVNAEPGFKCKMCY